MGGTCDVSIDFVCGGLEIIELLAVEISESERLRFGTMMAIVMGSIRHGRENVRH
jgi:hypothetical protein